MLWTNEHVRRPLLEGMVGTDR